MGNSIMDKYIAFMHFIPDITNHMTDFNCNEMGSEPFKTLPSEQIWAMQQETLVL